MMYVGYARFKREQKLALQRSVVTATLERLRTHDSFWHDSVEKPIAECLSCSQASRVFETLVNTIIADALLVGPAVNGEEVIFRDYMLNIVRGYKWR